MNIRILQNIPFFSHLTVKEIQALLTSAKTKQVLKGEKIDLRKNQFFGIIIDGLFETGQRARGDILYLLAGSFFGEMPFAVSRQTGYVKAVKDSAILLLKPEDMYKAFVLSYKGLKGYIRNIKQNGLEITGSGNDFLKCGSKVITFFCPSHNAGNSILAAITGLLLSGSGNTIILDASHNGNSIFNIFDQDLPPAVSQKTEENVSEDKFIHDRIVNAGENLSLLNISSGSKIKVNPDILSPIIFILSRKYKYIIIDHSDFMKDFTNRILGVSDIVFTVLKSVKDKFALYSILDSSLKDGQRVYYILNRFFAKNIGTFEGGYMLEDLQIPKKEKIINNLKNYITGNNKQKLFDKMSELIISEKTGLAIQTNLPNSVFLAGFFSLLYEKDVKIDMVYASSWSYLITALFILSKDQEEFEKNFFEFFTESRINSFLEISFPEEYVYKNSRIYNFACDLAGDNRLEHYSMLPAALLSEAGTAEQSIFSTGFVRDIFTASFTTDIFEPKRIADSYFHSGFSSSFVKPEDLLRSDINEIRCVCVNNKKKLMFGEKKLSRFYKGYINGLEDKYDHSAFPGSAKNFVIDVDVEKYNLKEILKISKEICKDFKW